MVTTSSAFIFSLATLFSLARADLSTTTTANCVVRLPQNPLTAEGLSSPFILSRGSCDQRDPKQRVFAEATVYDPATKRFAVYHPLVINEDTQPAIEPTVPFLPAEAVVILKLSTSANSLTLTGNTQTCSGISSQAAACNAAAFFSAASSAADDATSFDADSPACAPSQELASRVFTTYLESAYGELAQRTHKNRAVLEEYSEFSEAPRPRCSSWLARSLMEPYAVVPSKALYDLYTSKRRQTSSSSTSTGLHRQFRRHSHLKGCSNRDDAGDATLPEGADICVPVPRNITDNETLDNKFGPLTAADRDLVRKVRLASLWELPIATEAGKRSKNHKVRKISQRIQEQHEFLDDAVISISKQLNIQLPEGPSSEQACWMCEIRSAQTDEEYDNNYIKRLRFAHGAIFTTIGTVRGTTRNSAIRAFAETANLFVLGHMQLLESTGLTNTSSFPAAPPVNLVQ